MRTIEPINFDWYYKETFEQADIKQGFDKCAYEEVVIPHTNKHLPYNNFDETLYAFVSCYKKELVISPHYKGKQIWIAFEGVGHYAKVYLNTTYIGEHKGGYTAFEFNLTEAIDWEGINELTVVVDSTERSDIPPFGNVIDYLTYGGIYREVSLKVVEERHIKDVFIHTKEHLSANKRVNVGITLTHPQLTDTVEFQLVDYRGRIMAQWKSAVQGAYVEVSQQVGNVDLWELENPVLYHLHVTLKNKLGEAVDEVIERFGFREVHFETNGFYLNGKQVKIRGLNRHQSFVYVGYAMPKSQQEKDAELLKWDLGCNLVRTSHYPQSKHFLRRCDEIGLMVFTEIPGWQYVSKDKVWREVVLQNVEEMIVRDRNHPSIILWGVRINESQDDDELYKATNELAHHLDPTRQTGGVRNFGGSNLLEDVYTYNDFVHTGTNQPLDTAQKIAKSNTAPYMVSEHNGHMFPTKRFDHEAKRLEHALRHMRVLNSMYGDERISGAVGWCMFDYNTHKDFGSGDKICYHGVMDMFRIPKLAAAVYASQQDEQDVLEISSSMDIGDHAGGQIGDVYAFTNCDYVVVYKNDCNLGKFYPDTKQFPHVPHPPIRINDFIGDQLETVENYSAKDAKLIKPSLLDAAQYGLNMPFNKKLRLGYALVRTKSTMEKGVELYGKYVANWGGNMVEYRFEGYKKGKCVKTVVKGAVTKPQLRMTIDTQLLVEDRTYDVTRIVLEAVDEYGNQLPFANDIISIQVEGPIQLIGDETVALIGGVQGIYIRTVGENGMARITMTSKYLGIVSTEVEVAKLNA